MTEFDRSFDAALRLRADALWNELRETSGQPPGAPAQAIGPALLTSGADVLARCMTGLVELAGDDPKAAALLPHLAVVLRTARSEVVAAALERVPAAARHPFVERALAVLPITALGPLTLGSLSSTHPAQPFGGLLIALTRAAISLPEPVRATSARALTTVVRSVLGRWAAPDSTALEPYGGAATSPGALRVLQLSLETGAVGPSVWRAMAAQLSTEAGVRGLLDMIRRAPPGAARDAIAARLATPERMAALLEEEPVSWDAVDTVLEHLRLAAVAPMLDRLVESSHRATRRALIERLSALGDDIQPMVVERLNDQRWYVTRNMVNLLRESGSSLRNVPIEDLMAHPDARVRRETFQLRLENPRLRERAIVEGLGSSDKHLLRAALQAARQSLSDPGVAVLARRVTEPDFPAEYRVLAIHLLARSRLPAALEALIRIVHGGRTLLGRARLAPRSPEMLAALSGLARGWPLQPRARELLNLAGRSSDAEIRKALSAVFQAGTEKP